jgi:hypothetical protein
MFDKKKMHFWRLAFIFAGFTILVLFFQWSYPKEQKAAMMNVSMGQMMKNMQLSNVNIRDLVKGNEMAQSSSSSSNSTSSHHEDGNSNIVNMSFLTTAILFLLLPFIIGGSIILTIIWIK